VSNFKDKPYTFDDLAIRMRDYADAQRELSEARAKVEGQKAILRSHELQVEHLSEKVEKVKLQVRIVLNDLEK
jgi:vacuolar-type H+-ATPase subunit B/Vma2